MKNICFFLFIPVLFIFLSTVSFTETRADDEILDATRHLERYSKVNDEPHYMPPPMAVACAPASPVGSNNQPDPHQSKYLNVYVNEKGFSEMTGKKKPSFPVGTMIIKEKMTKQGDASKSTFSPAEFFTIMIKREKGYNPACGDWEFASVEAKTAKVTRGKIASCMSCHVNYKETDLVYRSNYLGEKYAKSLQ
jgi:hypothetical protein